MENVKPIRSISQALFRFCHRVLQLVPGTRHRTGRKPANVFSATKHSVPPVAASAVCLEGFESALDSPRNTRNLQH